MALREDYYTPCIDEINSKIGALEEIKDEIESRNYDEEFGVENSGSSDDIEEKIKKILNKLDDMIEVFIIFCKKQISFRYTGCWF